MDETISPFEEERQAIDRIARTGDGHLLHRYLRRVLEAVFDVSEAGPLQSHNGRRTLARDLMGLMAEGLEQSAGRSSDEPLLAARRQPAAVRPAGRRRVQLEPGDLHFEPGIPTEPTGPTGNGSGGTDQA